MTLDEAQWLQHHVGRPDKGTELGSPSRGYIESNKEKVPAMGLFLFV
jgi:hypothetical protein